MPMLTRSLLATSNTSLLNFLRSLYISYRAEGEKDKIRSAAVLTQLFGYAETTLCSIYLDSHASHYCSLMSFQCNKRDIMNFILRFSKKLLARSGKHFLVLPLYLHLRTHRHTRFLSIRLLILFLVGALNVYESIFVTWAIPVTDIGTP